MNKMITLVSIEFSFGIYYTCNKITLRTTVTIIEHKNHDIYLLPLDDIYISARRYQVHLVTLHKQKRAKKRKDSKKGETS